MNTTGIPGKAALQEIFKLLKFYNINADEPLKILMNDPGKDLFVLFSTVDDIDEPAVPRTLRGSSFVSPEDFTPVFL